MKDNAINLSFLTIFIFILFIGNHLIRVEYTNRIDKALVILLKNDEKTNKRVTDIGRTVYSKNAMVSKEDWDSHPEWQEHIDEKHTSYGNLCRKYRQFIENKNK